MPESIQAILDSNKTSEEKLNAILPEVCRHLSTDRCFLHLRDPQRRIYKNLCWRRSEAIPDKSTPTWQQEEFWEKEDPMFAAALACKPSIFVEDVENTDASILNVNFERRYFGHTALIHAHLCQEGQLRAILQPCLFSGARVWSFSDRNLINSLTETLLPLAISAVEQAIANGELQLES